MSRRTIFSLSIFAGVVAAAGCLMALRCDAQEAQLRSAEYAQVQQRLARGWNTWDTHSVTTQVLLPEGLTVRVGIKDQGTEGSDGFLPTA